MKAKFFLGGAGIMSALLFGGCVDTHTVPAAATHSTAAAGLQVNNIRMFNAREGWSQVNGPAGGRILRTTDGARTWQDVTPWLGPQYPNNFWACEFSKPQTAWLTYHTKTATGLLMTTNGGMSWWPFKTPFGFFTEGSHVHFVNDRFGVAEVDDGGLGSTYATFYETHDAGMTWKRMEMKPPEHHYGDSPGTFHLSNINGDRMGYSPGGTFVIAEGESGDETPKGYIGLMASIDAGKSWRDVHLPLPGQWPGVSAKPQTPVFFGPRDGILPVELFKEPGDDALVFLALLFYRTSDGGQTWTAPPPIAVPTNGLGYADCDVISKNNIVVRSGGVLKVTHDGARTWQRVQPNIDLGRENSPRDVMQMSFTDATHGWMIISDNTAFAYYGNYSCYKTVNGGKTWAELPANIQD